MYPGEDKLNAKQRRFYREWLIDYNATQAAIRSGYSPDTAYAQGSRLLKHAEGVKYLMALQEDLNAKLTITREDVINEMAKIGFSDIRSVFTSADQLKSISSLDDRTAAAVQSVEVVTRTLGQGDDAEVEYTHKIKLGDKMKALHNLGQHFNIYEDHQKSGQGEINIVIEGKDALL